MPLPRSFRWLRVPAFVLVAIASFAALAAAHDTWLLPATMHVPVGREVTLDLTSGMLFPNDDFPIAANRVKRSVVRLGATSRALSVPEAAPRSLRYRWTPPVEGVASIGIELAPKTLMLEPDKIEEYFQEIDASRELRGAWAALGGKRPWVESYSKHAKTFVRVGRPAADSSWRTPLGLGLEIIPLRDPTVLKVGDTLVVRVIRGSRPIPNFAVGAIREGTERAVFARTNAAGRASIVLRKAGRLLLNGTDLRRSNSPGLVWESDFTTLTIAVAPAS